MSAIPPDIASEKVKAGNGPTLIRVLYFSSFEYN
jgi:hypothetical protein